VFRTSARVGDLVLVIGMVGRDRDGRVVDGVAAQTLRALERIEEVLADHGLDRRALVRLRVFLTDIGDWPEVRDVIEEFLGGTWPPAIAMAVSALVEPAMKVELEADASAS
jgi:2-iminobutanoate/2-iminopropanoate deaminase